ncbi:MAG: RdgB/HAM1 family non-canonical purine NTP pyrophosphatase [Candidatus Aminicenantes bacterium]|nr:MAG: RdgB/HAM1 family non-canonical purine NTP pyrophosphatase [Candidatus Aminicenantes bacterium]
MTEEGLLLATTNQGKIKELEARLQDLPLDIFSLKDLHMTQIFPEEGKTFLENARGKSLYYSRYWKNLTLAEDSGITIDYLNGAPGVYSSRFAGPNATDEDNLQKVLRLLDRIPLEKRKARFISCMVLSRSGQIITEIQEHADGIITLEKKGQEGFGYDPIFFYPPLGKTFAELSPNEKNTVSHRGRVLEKLYTFFLNYLNK